MIVPDFQINQLGSDLVEPFNSDHVEPASIDLELGREFIVFDPHRVRAIDLRAPESFANLGVKKWIDYDEEFVLHPGEFILAVTKETVTLPRNIAARIEGKSSIGRIGLIIHATAGFIDPGFHGPLTLEMANMAPAPIILRPGDLICQVSFCYMAASVANPYNGRYQNAKGVEASKYGVDRFPNLSPNHPAMGNLTEEEFYESGYDGPMVK